MEIMSGEWLNDAEIMGVIDNMLVENQHFHIAR